MKRFALTALTILAVLSLSCSAFSESWSWGQINQSLARGENWQRYVTERNDFQLGEKKPYEGSDSLFVQAWGDYPSIDGSTVCVPIS